MIVHSSALRFELSYVHANPTAAHILFIAVAPAVFNLE